MQDMTEQGSNYCTHLNLWRYISLDMNKTIYKSFVVFYNTNKSNLFFTI